MLCSTPYKKSGNNDGGTLFSIGRFSLSMRRGGVSDPEKDFVLSFCGERGIYRWVEALGFTPNFQQEELMWSYNEAVMGRGEPKIACRAGKGPGKTRITAAIMTHWNLTHPKSALIITAPTFRQCKDVWLAEAKAIIYSNSADPRIGKLFDFVGKGFGILGSKPSEWGCQLITALSKEAFQGLHRKFIAFLEEEASGVKADISNAIKETISNAKGTYLHVRIGNPNSRLCAFFDSFYNESDQWECLHWNTEETPETEYFSKRRNKEIEDEFGRDSDVYRISVLGEFPSLDPNCLISGEDLDDCCTMETLNNVHLNNPDMTKQIGIDLARYGGDECVTVSRQGGILFDMWAAKTDPNNAIDKAIMYQEQYNWNNTDCMYVIDTSGMGESVVGVIGGPKYMGKKVHEFYSQRSPYHSDKYCDMITEAWCLFAKQVKNRLVYLGEKIDKKLKLQLTTRRYVVDRKTGRIKIESKDDYAKNMKDSELGTVGKSPDRADGMVMAFYPYASVSTRVAVGL